MRISDWSSDVCSSDLTGELLLTGDHGYVCYLCQPDRLSVRRLEGKVLDLRNLLAQIGWCPYAGPSELLTHPAACSHLAIDQRCYMLGNRIGLATLQQRRNAIDLHRQASCRFRPPLGDFHHPQDV